MKVTRLGDAIPKLIAGYGFSNLVPAGGTAGQVVTANGSNGVYWGENVARITANGSNIITGPFVNFAAGSNIIFSNASNTLTIHGQAGGGGGTIITANGSNGLSAVVNLVAGTGIALGVSSQDITITNTGSAGGGGSGSSGALVLLASQTASTSATIDFTTRNATGQSGAIFQSDYDEYIFEFIGVVPVTDNVNFPFRAGTGGGPTYDSGGNYAGSGFRWSNTGTAVTGATAGTAFNMDVSGGIDNGAGRGISGHLKLYMPQSTSPAPRVTHQASWTDNANVPLGAVGNGQYNGGAAMTAVRWAFSSGNISVGTFRCYGVAK